MTKHETFVQYLKIGLLGLILTLGLAAWDLTSRMPKVEAQLAAQSGFQYTHISTATNTLIKTASATLHTVVINGGTAGAVSVFDATAAACTGGSTVAIIATSTVSSETLAYDIQTTNGLCVTTAAATDVTISWR
jgi:hypothetical protein